MNPGPRHDASHFAFVEYKALQPTEEPALGTTLAPPYLDEH